MKTKIVSLFSAFAILSILLVSCSFIEKSSGTGELSFSIPSSAISRMLEDSKNSPSRDVATNEGEEAPLKVTATVTGSSSGTKTQTSPVDFESIHNADFNISFTFSDLNTNDTYKITVDVYEVYGSENFKIYTGSAENIRLTEGEITTVKITLTHPESEHTEEETGITTDIILYNKGEEPANHALYVFDKDFLTSGAQIAPKATYSEGKAFTDFVIDSTNNIYFTDGVKIYREDTEIAEVSMTIDGTNYGITDLKIFKDESGIIFYGGMKYADNKSNFILNSYDIGTGTSSSAVKYAEDFVTSWFDFATSLGEPVTTDDDEKTTFTYTGYLYLSGMTSNSSDGKYKYGNIVFFKIPLTYTVTSFSNGEGSSSIELATSEAKIINFADSSPNFSATISDDAKISDIAIQDGNLYALLDEVYFDKYGQQIEDGARFTNYSRGAIITINFSDFSSAGAFADGSIMAAKPFTAPASDTETEDGPATTECAFFSVYQPDEGKYFCGAQKFLAIKPKKLVFSGDGYYFYTDAEGHFCFKNVNEVYVYDERKQSATAYTLSTTIPIQFEGDKTSAFDFDCAGTAGFEISTKAYYKE